MAAVKSLNVPFVNMAKLAEKSILVGKIVAEGRGKTVGSVVGFEVKKL